MQPSPSAAGRSKKLSYANMPMAFVRKKLTKEMALANNKKQQTKAVAKKSRKAIWAEKRFSASYAGPFNHC